MAYVKTIQVEKDLAVSNYVKIADKTAATADQYKSTLGEMDSWGGLGAIWYGLKRLFVRFIWIFGILLVLYLILRFASLSNPIAASIFSIFSRIGSWFVNIIEMLVPRAASKAGFIAQKTYNTTKETLTKVVDAIEQEEIKHKIQTDTIAKVVDVVKQPVKPLLSIPTTETIITSVVPPVSTVQPIKEELSKVMDTEHKAVITNIKKQLLYVK